ncbi:MAG: hypothetical protein AB1489_34275 [Acidobacteriota bacterium]
MSVTAVAGVFRTMGITTIINVMGTVGIMDLKQCSNGDLITQLVTPDLSPSDEQNIRQEFLGRFEHMLVREIRAAFDRVAPRLLAPQLQATPEAVCDVIDEVIFRLSNSTPESINKLSQQPDSRIEVLLAALAYRTALLYLYSRGKDITH